MTIESPSTQAKLLARFLRTKGFAVPHSLALEALAHAQNLKSFNVLSAQDSKATVQAPLKDPRAHAMDLVRQAMALGLNFGDTCTVFAETQSPIEKLYAEAAMGHTRDGELEVDPNAVVSLGDDKGAYVMSWTWVYQSDLELPSSPALLFSMNYDRVAIERNQENCQEVRLSDLEQNQEALNLFIQGAELPDTLWLIRTPIGAVTKDARTQEPCSVQLTVKDFKALKRKADGTCYEGQVDGQALFLEFFED